MQVLNRYFEMKKLTVLLIVLLIVLLFSSSASAMPGFDVGSGAINKVYDGDGLKVRMRLAHIDTPEINGACEHERVLAIQARDFTQGFVNSSRNMRVVVVGTGHFGRPLVEVRSSNGYLNQLLLDNGLARIYDGKRYSWCE